MTGRVLVLGNASVDLVMTLPHLPRPGETVVGPGVARAPGGKGLNQAVMAARAGATVAFCAPLGDDADGAFVAAALRAESLEAHLPRPGPPTDLSVVMVAADAENAIVSTGACADALDPADAETFAAAARPGDVLLLQGNLTQATTLAAARAARAREAGVLFNTAPVRWPAAPVVAHCTVTVANALEAEQLAGATAPLSIVTRGAAGCVANGRHYPAPAVRAIDTTGAGDAFCGVLAAALACGMDLDTALSAAQRAAADTVTRPGAFAALPRRFELGGPA